MSFEMPSVDYVNTILDLAEKHGVRRISVGPAGLLVEYDPKMPPPLAADLSPIAPKDMSLGGPAMCKCSHDETEHGQGGYCLRGCDMAKCGPVSDTT